MGAGFLAKGLSGVSENSRSTILKSIGGLMLSLLAAIILVSWLTESNLLIIFLIILLSITFAVFIFTFVYCLFTNPNLLRSETHTEKMKAIEKGYYIGDNASGFHKLIDESDDNELLGTGKNE